MQAHFLFCIKDNYQYKLMEKLKRNYNQEMVLAS